MREALRDVLGRGGDRPGLEVQHGGQLAGPELRDDLRQAVPLRELRGTAGGNNENARGLAPSSERGQQIRRRGVGPVHVFEHEHQRLFGGDEVERFGELAKHAGLVRPVGAERQRLEVLVVDETRHLREPRRRVPREQLDPMPAVRSAAQRTECLEDRQVRLRRAKMLDARAACDERSARRCRLGQKRIDDCRLSDPRVSRDEDHLPLRIEGPFERLPERAELEASPHDAGRGATHPGVPHDRRLLLGRLHLDREKKAIAAPDDCLEDALPQSAPHVADVSPEEALADDDVLPPHRFDQLLLGQEPLGMRGEVPQEDERLAPQLDLRAVPE